MPGAIVFVISVVTMGDSWRAGVSKTDKTNLVTDGIYQIVNVEEDFLLTAFGEEYLAYRKKVCRYLGRKK